MKIIQAFQVRFYPYDTELGRQIAGSMDVTFIGDRPTAQKVLQAFRRYGISEGMEERILAKDFYISATEVYDGSSQEAG